MVPKTLCVFRLTLFLFYVFGGVNKDVLYEIGITHSRHAAPGCTIQLRDSHGMEALLCVLPGPMRTVVVDEHHARSAQR